MTDMVCAVVVTHRRPVANFDQFLDLGDAAGEQRRFALQQRRQKLPLERHKP